MSGSPAGLPTNQKKQADKPAVFTKNKAIVCPVFGRQNVKYAQILTLLFTIGFLEIKWVDILDILLVSVLLYNLYKLVRGTAALRIFTGFLVLYFLFLLIQATEMELLTAILDQFMGVGVLAAIILFQQEIRKFLILLGSSAELNDNNLLGSLLKWRRSESETQLNISAVSEAMKIFGQTKTGMLIVLNKKSDLQNYAQTGDLLNAEVNKRLLMAIFNKYSPLHDGAVIIQSNKVVAARCILPVSENSSIPASMGLRHRAGIGMSEVTDTLVLLVSEETGQFSCAQNGKVFPNLSLPEIRGQINAYLSAAAEKPAESPTVAKSSS